jgi:hypothetical protein
MDGQIRRRIRNPAARLIALRSHHTTHRHLLKHEPSAGARRVEIAALVIPAGRPIAWLREGMALAAGLSCVLVAFCSRQITAADVTELGEEIGVSTVALEMRACAGLLPAFPTSQLIADSDLAHISDSSQKRNLGLAMARVAGWRRVLFLDDDIHALDAGDAEVAAALLDGYSAVGLANDGFPDNSVVCHAYRAIGGPQEQFIGVGGMAVSPTRSSSLFPEIYNADWLFVLGDAWPPRVAVTGSMRQKTFDPFANPDRARSEEFGDCIAEGLYWLLDEGQSINRADYDYWERFLNRRARFIERLIHRAWRTPLESALRSRIISSLETARLTHETITAGLCTEFVRRWQDDLEGWRRFIDDLPTGLGIDGALNELGLSDAAHRSNI